MLREITLTKSVVINLNSLGKNKEVLASVVANFLLKQLSNNKVCEYGYFLAVTKLVSIGDGDTTRSSQYIIFPVDFCCRLYIPMAGEVLTGVVHQINENGVFIRSGPMKMVYLPSRLMGNYNFVSGETPTFLGEDSSKIGIGVVVRYVIFAVKWIQDRWREFRVLASIEADGLGPVASNGLDGMDL